ncbi:hypothetical protein [Nocardioides sp. GY 10127]|uniref:hypothetical protein n=1 Tax=Nocardioides sp. GY 10127 TaxID=2569762 RepID=UPI0010A83545|nr:hypothetical protein [Nocardioides sp. GY 10127]TIC78911.1 hypothetical protein E8D37_18710 [Nocardioides sp. GY 10127]
MPGPSGTTCPPRDQGVALVITMMVAALVVVLGTTVLRVSVGNLSAADDSRDAAAALDAADAGVTQAIARMRSGGLGALACSPSCTSEPWGNSASPAGYDLGGWAPSGGTVQSFRAWIQPILPWPANDPAVYRVHSTGRAGDGVRSIEVDVSVRKNPDLPIAMFGRSVSGGGAYAVTRISVLSTGCVYRRDKISVISSIDPAYGIPAGVHSSQAITTANGNSTYCSDAVSGSGGGKDRAIHAGGACAKVYPFDQDVRGGSLTGLSDCAAATGYPDFYGSVDTDGDGVADVIGSKITSEAALRALFGIGEDPFDSEELDDLRALARSQGTYYTSTSFGSGPSPTVQPHAVMFFDLLGTASEGGVVDLKDLSTAWNRPADGTCPDRSLLIVVDGGNLRLNGNAGSSPGLAASIVLTSRAPYGQVMKNNGTANLIGTIYADSLDLTGTGDVSLDECFMNNLSPALLRFSTGRYVEVDR